MTVYKDKKAGVLASVEHNSVKQFVLHFIREHNFLLLFSFLYSAVISQYIAEFLTQAFIITFFLLGDLIHYSPTLHMNLTNFLFLALHHLPSASEAGLFLGMRSVIQMKLFFCFSFCQIKICVYGSPWTICCIASQMPLLSIFLFSMSL